MNTLLSALLLACAVYLVLPREVALIGAPPIAPNVDAAEVMRRRILAAAALAGLAVWLLTGGGALSALLGAGSAMGAARVLYRMTGNPRIDPVVLQRQAADAAELMAACLASGATLQRTTAEVARALQAPISVMLHEANAMMTMGAAVDVAWQGLASHEETAPIGRAVIRSANSGAPSAEALLQVAADLRNRRHAAAQTRVRSVAVAAVGPLGLCFLPAFLLLGVVPVVVVLIGSRSGS